MIFESIKRYDALSVIPVSHIVALLTLGNFFFFNLNVEVNTPPRISLLIDDQGLNNLKSALYQEDLL